MPRQMSAKEARTMTIRKKLALEPGDFGGRTIFRCPCGNHSVDWARHIGGGPERVGTKNSVEDAGDQQEGITARQEGAVATPCFRRLCPWLNPANSFSFSSHAAATATGSLRRSGRREKRGI
jgi:hypothetical protein